MIVAYAMAVHVFFVLLEVFTVVLQPGARARGALPVSLRGPRRPIGRSCPGCGRRSALAIVSLASCSCPATRRRDATLAAACAALFVSLWIDKGLGLVVGGFVPSPLGRGRATTRRRGAKSRSPPASGRSAPRMVTGFFKIAAEVRADGR